MGCVLGQLGEKRWMRLWGRVMRVFYICCGATEMGADRRPGMVEGAQTRTDHRCCSMGFIYLPGTRWHRAGVASRASVGPPTDDDTGFVAAAPRRCCRMEVVGARRGRKPGHSPRAEGGVGIFLSPSGIRNVHWGGMRRPFPLVGVMQTFLAGDGLHGRARPAVVFLIQSACSAPRWRLLISGRYNVIGVSDCQWQVAPGVELPVPATSRSSTGCVMPSFPNSCARGCWVVGALA
jgi:hypothetical protein